MAYAAGARDRNPRPGTLLISVQSSSVASPPVRIEAGFDLFDHPGPDATGTFGPALLDEIEEEQHGEQLTRPAGLDPVQGGFCCL